MEETQQMGRVVQETGTQSVAAGLTERAALFMV